MNSPSAAPEPGERLSAVFIGIVLVEAVVIAGLYYFGVYFS